MTGMVEMPTQTWRELIRQKRRGATFRILLMVRGREVVKVYRREEDFKTWLETYRAQQRQPASGVESVQYEVVGDEFDHDE